jgi:hypothetical protein
MNFKPPKKEIPVPTEQEEIDAAVREAIEKPRREREIARRVEAVTTLDELLAGTEDGTVLRFKRTHGTQVYDYAALKAGDSKWYVTGSVGVDRHGYTTERLVEWMTTGPTMVHDLVVASGWDSAL